MSADRERGVVRGGKRVECSCQRGFVCAYSVALSRGEGLCVSVRVWSCVLGVAVCWS